MPIKGRADIQLAVDEYVRLYAEVKQLETKLDELRAIIEPYMVQEAVRELSTTDGSGRLVMNQSERPVMSARYTSYDVNEIAALLPPNLRKKCIVEVVDKDKLEALSKLGEVSPDVVARKITRSTTSLMVRLDKR
ncbi:MAG: hypothetical protein K6T83_11085 [Alicyclobacillus sp.]|nr:hypothetical protein [Alicyclobacillus sp.]